MLTQTYAHIIVM